MKITEYKFGDHKWVLVDDEKSMRPLCQEARHHYNNMVAIQKSLAGINEVPVVYSEINIS